MIINWTIKIEFTFSIYYYFTSITYNCKSISMYTMIFGLLSYFKNEETQIIHIYDTTTIYDFKY